MAGPVATLGDPASHPGTITSACERHLADNGAPIARQGDIFNCEIHGPSPIVGNVSETVEIEGAMVARHGSVTACGAIIRARATSPEL